MKTLPNDISTKVTIAGVPVGSLATQSQTIESQRNDEANERIENNKSPLPSQSPSTSPTGDSRTPGRGGEIQELYMLPTSAEPAMPVFSLPASGVISEVFIPKILLGAALEAGASALGSANSRSILPKAVAGVGAVAGSAAGQAGAAHAVEKMDVDEPQSGPPGSGDPADCVDSADKMGVYAPQATGVGTTTSSGAPAPAFTAVAASTTVGPHTVAAQGVVLIKEVTAENYANAATEVPAPKKGVKDMDSITTTAIERSNPRDVQPKAAVAGPDVFPPPLEAVIDIRRDDAERGSGGGATDRLYGMHCLEREVAARSFFREQDFLRRRFQAAVDLVELDKAVECSGLELRSGCRTVQTIKMRLKTRWRQGIVLPNGGGLSRCTTKEAHQAEQKWQEQVRIVIADHRELLGELMGRQRLEAGALQMSQKMEVAKGSAPLLQIRFAFPRMFEEVS